MRKSAIFWLAMIAAPALGQQPAIRSKSDLPPMQFKLDAKPSLAFSDTAFLKNTVPALRIEAERILSTYRVEDPAIAQRLRSGLAAIAILQGRPADADRLIAEQRAIAAKPQLQKIGLLLLDLAAAKAQAASGQGCAASASRLTQRLVNSDPAVVRDEAIARYSDVQTASIPYYAGAAVFVMEDRAIATGGIEWQRTSPTDFGRSTILWQRSTRWHPRPSRADLTSREIQSETLPKNAFPTVFVLSMF